MLHLNSKVLGLIKLNLIAITGQMKVLDGEVNIHSDAFKKNLEEMNKINEDLDSKIHKILKGGGEKANLKHKERGKLLGKIVDALKEFY